MKAVFVDTGYLLALEIANDQHHQAATQHWQGIVAALPRLVTTSYVFDEVVTFFKLHRPVKKVDVMINIHKKIVVDEKGNPQEVIIPWDEFQEIAEILGIDLDPEALEDLRQARRDREAGRQEAYIDLDNL